MSIAKSIFWGAYKLHFKHMKEFKSELKRGNLWETE